jgi:hypothetical protein
MTAKPSRRNSLIVAAEVRGGGTIGGVTAVNRPGSMQASRRTLRSADAPHSGQIHVAVAAARGHNAQRSSCASLQPFGP